MDEFRRGGAGFSTGEALGSAAGARSPALDNAFLVCPPRCTNPVPDFALPRRWHRAGWGRKRKFPPDVHEASIRFRLADAALRLGGGLCIRPGFVHCGGKNRLFPRSARTQIQISACHCAVFVQCRGGKRDSPPACTNPVSDFFACLVAETRLPACFTTGFGLRLVAAVVAFFGGIFWWLVFLIGFRVSLRWFW